MRTWGWIKPVVLDVLSSPFLGPIGSCRTEALVSGGRRGRIFPFFALAKKTFCMRVMSVLPAEGCKEPGQKGSSWGLRETMDPDLAVLWAPHVSPYRGNTT